MSTASHDLHTDYEAVTDAVHHEHHPSNAVYWQVGAALAVITGLEVSTYFITDDPYSHSLAPVLIGGLLTMMVIKFVTIAAFFMHLKFDNKIYRNMFLIGLILAVAVYAAVMASLQFWDSSYEGAVALL